MNANFSQKRILSVDVGIKNLGLCIFYIDNNTISLQKWETVSLTNETTKLCSGYTLSNKKCNKNARFCDKENNYYCAIHSKKLPNTFLIKNKQASKESLIDLGRNMKSVFDDILNEVGKIDVLLIENQISPIATRMKTLQGMIIQYFIIKNTPEIEIISSQNKLKVYTEYVNELKSEKTSYGGRKKMGISLTQKILDNEENWKPYKHLFVGKKKDDLADAFLQGLYWGSRQSHNFLLF